MSITKEMKILVLLAIISICLSCAQPKTSDYCEEPEIASGCLIYYSECGFGGHSEKVCRTPIPSDLGAAGNDWTWSGDIKSIRIGIQTSVVLFDTEMYQGQSLLVEGDVSCVTDLAVSNGLKLDQNTNEFRVNSLVTVSVGCVGIFDSPKFMDFLRIICEDDARSSGYNSILVPVGFGIELYAQNNFQGERQTIYKSTPNTNALSLKLKRGLDPGCAIFYDKLNFADEYEKHCNLWGSLGGFSEDITSMKIGPLTTVILFREENFNGDSYVFTPESDNLDDLGQSDWDDNKGKSGVILKPGCAFIYNPKIREENFRVCNCEVHFEPRYRDRMFNIILGSNTRITIGLGDSQSDYDPKTHVTQLPASLIKRVYAS